MVNAAMIGLFWCLVKVSVIIYVMGMVCVMVKAVLGML